MLLVRVLYYLFDFKGIQDTYGYFAAAMLSLEEGEITLSSGLGFAYTNALTRGLSLFGTDISVAFLFQFILSTISLLLFYFGARLVWGTYSALGMCSVLSFSPIMLNSLKVCSPEEYIMFHVSVLFFILAFFYVQTKKHTYKRSSLAELFLVVVGFYTGIICAWNYLGFLVLLIMGYIVINNYQIYDDKSKFQEMTEKEDLEEKDQIMNGFIQLLVLLFGAVLGLFFSLLKYTGYSGLVIGEQFRWWFNLFKSLPNRTMDIDSAAVVNILFSFVLALIISTVCLVFEEKHKNDYLLSQSENITPKEEKEGVDYFVTDDGRKVSYIKNPLQGPKKHEPKTMKFDLDELAKLNQEAMIIESDNDDKRYSIKQNDKKVNKVKEEVNENTASLPQISKENLLEFDLNDLPEIDDFDI